MPPEFRRLAGRLAVTGILGALLVGALPAGAAPAAVLSAVGAAVASPRAATSLPAATYPPCAVIAWRYDGSAAPRSGAGMPGDVRGALGLVAGRTGISFVEAPAEAMADLVFDWSPLADYEPGTQAAAWRSQVTFATGGEMTRDAWSGFRSKAVRRPNGSFDVGTGRGWLVVHEVLHALPRPGFSPGDLATLAANYPRAGCPAESD